MRKLSVTICISVLILLLSSCQSTGETAENISAEPETAVSAEETATALETTASVIVIENETDPPETVPEAETEEEDIPPEAGMVRSFLTGSWITKEQAAKRPVAVMYPTDKKAQPQYGLSKVSVFYEILEEGSMSRQMGILEDYTGLSRIGNIRSIRDYFIYEALEWDPILVHFGGPEVFVKDLLTREDVDNLNGVSGVMGDDYGAFYRVPKNVTTTHNAYTDSEHLEKAIEKAGFSVEHRAAYWSDEKEAHWKFAKKEKPVDLSSYAEAKNAAELSMAGMFPIDQPTFSYNAEDGKYYRSIYGEPQKDALTGEQMAFDNILIESCVYGERGAGYIYYHVLDAGHFGWYITRGKMIPVRWQKTADYECTRFYDPVGNEITLNEGKTMICIGREGNDSFTADGEKYDL